MPSWQSSIESSVILSSSLNSQPEFFLNATHASAQCPPGRALQNSSEILSSSVPFLCTVLSPRCSTTLRSFPEFKTSAGAPSWHVLVQIPQNWKCTLCTGSQNPQCSVTPSWHEATKNPNLKSKNSTDSRTYLSLQMHTNHTSTTYKEHIKTFIHATQNNMQEKLLFVLM
jgi:hypothetical protein